MPELLQTAAPHRAVKRRVSAGIQSTDVYKRQDQEGGKYTFYVWDEDYRQALDVFSIYALTGGSREEDATVDGRFAFYRAEGVVYAAKLEANAAEFGITENQLINNFHLIQQDWKTGET